MDGVVEFYNKIYSGKPEKWDSSYRDEAAFFVLSHHTQEPKTFLDIGCGNGHTIEYFNKLWPDTEYYGVDLSDVAIEVARERVPEANFICATYEDADLKTCDVVVLMGVAEHFEELIDSLSELKKYGKLIYIESPNCLSYSANKGERFGTTIDVPGVTTVEQPEWHLTRNTWEGSIRHAGLEIVQGYKGPTPETEFIWMLR